MFRSLFKPEDLVELFSCENLFAPNLSNWVWTVSYAYSSWLDYHYRPIAVRSLRENHVLPYGFRFFTRGLSNIKRYYDQRGHYPVYHPIVSNSES